MQSNNAHIDVVTIESGCAAPAIADADRCFDPAFQSFSGINLGGNRYGLTEGTGDYLAHAVARDPTCLMTHVQRIALHVKRKEPDRVCGALVDLFIVLGARGMPLRKRMLNLAKRQLDLSMIEFLTANLRLGVSATDALPESGYSVLTKAVTGTTHLVEQTQVIEKEPQDPLQDARACLEFGQVEEAQRILEAAILQAPEREELHHDLLEIYRHTADRESFYNMQGQLELTGKTVEKLWEETAASFKNAVNQ